MILGLTGAHRTGKTTLAKAYAEKYGIEFVPSSASDLFAKLGLEPSDKLSIADRMMVQEAILDDMEAKLKSIRKREVGAIFDRTPFDLIAYTLCDVSNGSIESEEMEERVLKYIQRCYDVANKYFNVGVLVQPGIELKSEPGKAAMSRSYMEHMNTMIRGIVGDSRNDTWSTIIDRKMIGLQERIKHINNVVLEVYAKHQLAVRLYQAIAAEESKDAVMH